MTETYFADSELPMIVAQNSAGSWTVGCKWQNNGSTHGMSVSLKQEPDETDRELMHKTFMDDYKLWQQHKNEPPRIR